MIRPRQLAIVERHVRDAVAKGARVLAGGRRNRGIAGCSSSPPCSTTSPTTWRSCARRRSVRCCRSCACATRTRRSVSPTIRRYGLTATVWTRDAQKGLRLAKRVQSGRCCVNDCRSPTAFPRRRSAAAKSSGRRAGQRRGRAQGFCYAQPIADRSYRTQSRAGLVSVHRGQAQDVEKGDPLDLGNPATALAVLTTPDRNRSDEARRRRLRPV